MRKLKPRHGAKIGAFVLSFVDVPSVYICTQAGEIEQWNWITGSRLHRWKLSSRISHCAAPWSSPGSEDSKLFYTVDQGRTDEWRITAHRLKGGDDAKKTELKTLLRHSRLLTSLQILDAGKIMIATSGSRLIVGRSNQPQPESLVHLDYVWREIDTLEWIQSVNAQERPEKSNSSRAVIDIAVGGAKGHIYVYEDLLGELDRMEKGRGKEASECFKPRILHWHRNGVLTIKWSLDGRNPLNKIGCMLIM